MKMQECAYCWRKFKSDLKKCPYCGKEVKISVEKGRIF